MAKKIVLSNNPLFSGPTLADRTESAIPYKNVPLAAIERDPNQPRVNFDESKLEELANSIKTYGVLSPILVRPGKFPGKYILVAGERRFRACTKLDLPQVPVIVDATDDQTGERTLAIQLVENLQRADLAPLEKAYAISALKEAHKLSIRDVAARLGISKSSVQRSLELLDLPDDLINALRQGASESKVLMLAKVPEQKNRAKFLRGLDGLSREELAEKLKSKIRSVKASKLSPEDQRVMDEIRKAVGMKIGLKRNQKNGESGKLSINFNSEKDLQVIFRKLVS